MEPADPSQEVIHVEVYASYDQMDASDEEKAKYQALDQDIQTTVLYVAGCEAKLAALDERLHVPVPEKAPEGGTCETKKGLRNHNVYRTTLRSGSSRKASPKSSRRPWRMFNQIHSGTDSKLPRARLLKYASTGYPCVAVSL